MDLIIIIIIVILLLLFVLLFYYHYVVRYGMWYGTVCGTLRYASRIVA